MIGNMSSKPIVLHRYPAALSLPTVDPQALAVETAMRFLQVRYVKKDAAMRDLRIVVPSPPHSTDNDADANSAPPTTYHGFRDCMRHLSALTDADVVQSDHKHVVVCVEWIATKCLFPAFTFLVHFEPSLFHKGLRKTVVPKVGGLWERLCGSFQRNVLRANVFSYVCGTVSAPHGPPLSAAGARQVSEVLEEVEKAFRALELLHLSYAQTDETFFSGTLSPCSTDAYVYASVSCFLHADFGGPHGSPRLASFQATVREECSHLVRYVEWMRRMLYEDYNGKYGLKQINGGARLAEMDAVAEEDIYARGRTKMLLMTGALAFVYFIFSNSDIILSLLEEIAGSDKDDMITSAPEEDRLKEEDNA